MAKRERRDVQCARLDVHERSRDLSLFVPTRA
jgi:hypothetical protein